MLSDTTSVAAMKSSCVGTGGEYAPAALNVGDSAGIGTVGSIGRFCTTVADDDDICAAGSALLSECVTPRTGSAHVVHCAAVCSIERSASLMRSGSGGGPAALREALPAEEAATAKNVSLVTTGANTLLREGVFDEPADEIADEPADGRIDELRAASAARAADDPIELAGAVRVVVERGTSGRCSTLALTGRCMPGVSRVFSVCAGIEDSAAVACGPPAFSHPAGATGSSGSIGPAPRACKSRRSPNDGSAGRAASGPRA